MQLVAYYSIYNEADFIEYSLRSIYDHVDSIIIIEGAWYETFSVNSFMRSNDGTIELIKNFPDPDNKIQLYFHNERSQLKQRSKVFSYLPEEKFLLLLVDGDEVYEESEIKKIRQIADGEEAELHNVWRIESLTFVNDLSTYTPIAFPRIFKIDLRHSLNNKYEFTEPNGILQNGWKLNIENYRRDIRFFHYSYCHSPKRFMEKKRERTKLHGHFSWEISNGKVYKEGVQFQKFQGSHPQGVEKSNGANDITRNGEERAKGPKQLIVYAEHSGIGNMVMSTPTLKALRTARPNAQIEVVGWKRSNRIIEGLECVDIVHEIENPGFRLHFKDKTIDHLIVAPCGSHEGVISFLSQQSNCVHRITIPNGIWQRHESEYKMTIARNLGYKGPDPNQEVPISDYNIGKIRSVLNEKFGLVKQIPKIIAISACYLKKEHWPLKHWGNKNYAELLSVLSKDYNVIFLGSKEDFSDANDIIKQAKIDSSNKVINLCGFSDDIKDTAFLLTQVVLSIGNDGGLQHIAAAVGTPTVTIFTFTNHIKNRPISKCGKCVMVPCEHRLTCQHGQWQRCEEKGCLNVSVYEVLDTAKQLIKEAQCER
jgi:ADP-heptose:LPS heptosyltransferase